MSTIAAVIGRILISLMFIVSGISKLMIPGQTEAMLTSVGLSPRLALPVGIFEIVAGLCLAIGLMTRLSAILLAGFTVMATLMFHNQAGDPTQMPIILLHVALIGGLLLVFAHSQMWWNYDAMRRQRRGELLARDAEQRAHDAEVRAARAEGRVAGLGPETAAIRKRSWFG
jgi:putative oxidoreductase